jgi:hypothetical protein
MSQKSNHLRSLVEDIDGGDVFTYSVNKLIEQAEVYEQRFKDVSFTVSDRKHWKKRAINQLNFVENLIGQAFMTPSLHRETQDL